MSASAPEPEPVPRRARVYILVVAGLAAASLIGASRGPGVAWATLLWIVVLSIPLWWVGHAEVGNHVTLSLTSVILLAAAVILGPLGAGLLGLVLTGIERNRSPGWARLFNVSMSATLGVAGGVVYAAVGGRRDPSDLVGAAPLLGFVVVPLIVAAVAQGVINASLIAGIMRITQGVPPRLTAARLWSTTGVVYAGYGLLAFLLLLLWFSADLGPLSVLLLLPPLLGAHWANIQGMAQSAAWERSVDLLVAALEAKAPELAGHSARVAELSARTAEHLGLGVTEVADVRWAAMLHDVEVLAHREPAAAGELLDGVPAALCLRPPDDHATVGTASRLVEGMTFLTSAAEIVHEAREGGPTMPIAAQIVVAAATLDQRLNLAEQPGRLDVVLQTLRRDDVASPEVLDALTWTASRDSSPTGVTS